MSEKNKRPPLSEAEKRRRKLGAARRARIIDNALPALPSGAKFKRMTREERQAAMTPFMPLVEVIERQEHALIESLAVKIGIGPKAIRKKIEAVYAILGELVHEDKDLWTAEQRKRAEARATKAVVQIFKVLLPHVVKLAEVGRMRRAEAEKRALRVTATLRNAEPGSNKTQLLADTARAEGIGVRNVERLGGSRRSIRKAQ